MEGKRPTTAIIKPPKQSIKRSLIQSLFSSYARPMSNGGIHTTGKELINKRTGTQELFGLKNWRFNKMQRSRNNKLSTSQSKVPKTASTQVHFISSFSELEETLNGSRALQIAEDCSREIDLDLVSQAFPEGNKRQATKSKSYSESYNSGTQFFTKLLNTRKKMLKQFLGKVRRRKSAIKGMLNTTCPLEKVVKDIKRLELSYSFAKSKPTIESLVDMRQRRLKYSRWYLKPKDFSKSNSQLS